MGRIEKQKRMLIEEANKRVLGEQRDESGPGGQFNTNTGDLWGDYINLYGGTPSDEEFEKFKKERGITTQQNGKEIRVTWSHEEPYPGTDWDNVHGFGSKRLQNHFVDRIENKLKSGNYRIKDIEVGSELKGDKVITTAEAILVTDNNNPHKHVATRGSIGNGYNGPSKADAVKRHDEQVRGLEGRLEDYFGGTAEMIGGHNNYSSIRLPDGNLKWYKQSFYGVTD